MSGAEEGRLRGLLRRFARQENLVGFACSMGLTLVREGPAETAHRIRLRLGRKHAERKFVRRLLNPSAVELRRQRETVFPEEITFSVVVPLYNTPPEFLREMIASVQAQTYTRWELCLADGSDGEHAEVGECCRDLAAKDARIVYRRLKRNGGISANINACLDLATGRYIALFDHDDLLLPGALYEAARAIVEQGADFVYTDEMVFASPDRTKVIGLHFKPDFAPDDLLANNYICHLTVFRASLLEQAGRFRSDCDGSQDHDLILRLTAHAKRIVHIPKILYLWRSHPDSVAGDIGSKTYAVDAGRKAVRDFLESRGVFSAEVTSSPVYPTLYHVAWPVVRRPLISLIVDGGTDPERAAEGLCRLMEHSAWEQLEGIVAAAPEQAGERNGIRWVSAPGHTPGQRLNEAARQATGEALLFLAVGLDTDRPGWLEEMWMLCQREETGAVGSLILFEDGRVRHAGLILGFGKGGVAGRGHYRADGSGAGYFGQLAIVEDVSAVSAECLMIRRKEFEALGGFDEAFCRALYDVDLCLRLRERGMLVVYTPEPALRGGTREGCPEVYGSERPGWAEEAETFRQRWRGALEAGDPYYNPNLTLELSDFRVKG